MAMPSSLSCHNGTGRSVSNPGCCRCLPARQVPALPRPNRLRLAAMKRETAWLPETPSCHAVLEGACCRQLPRGLKPLASLTKYEEKEGNLTFFTGLTAAGNPNHQACIALLSAISTRTRSLALSMPRAFRLSSMWAIIICAILTGSGSNPHFPSPCSARPWVR